MIHVPMQDCGSPEVAQVFDFEAERPPGEAELGCGLHHHGECGAFQRNRIFSTQRIEITLATVIGGDHRETGEAALAGGRLTDFREAAEPAKKCRDRHYDLSQALSSGSRIQASKVRLS